MKKFLLSLLFINVSFCNVWAQNEWERPDAAVGKQKETVKTVTRKEKVEDPRYMAGAVTENEGKVEWTCKINMPGKSSQQLYDLCLGYLQDFVKEEDQLPESNVTLVNKSQRVIVATLNEWLVFKSTFLSLDIINQLSAAESLLRKARREVLKGHLDGCVREALCCGDEEMREKKLDEIIALLDRAEK